MKLDKEKVSKSLAKIVRSRLKQFCMTPEHLSEMTGLPEVRLCALLKKGEVFNATEIKAVGMALGITMAEVFPASPSQLTRYVQFLKKSGEGVGVFGAPAGISSRKISQKAFDLSMARLYHYTQCLQEF